MAEAELMVDLTIINGGGKGGERQHGKPELVHESLPRAVPIQEARNLLRPSPTPIMPVRNLRLQYRHELASYGIDRKIAAFEDPATKCMMVFKRHENPDGTIGGFLYSDGANPRFKKTEAYGAYISPTAVVGPNCRVSGFSRVLDRAWIDGLEMYGNCIVAADTIALFLSKPEIVRPYHRISGKPPKVVISKL